CNILITCRQGHKAGDNTAFDTLNVFCRGATGALSGLEKKQYKPVERFPQARASEAPPGDFSAPEYNIQVRQVILKIYSSARVTYYFKGVNG
ncbi:hypothetical protein, partial [Klebsiella pneumoniae]|uniref:hypothetical protein n=1 Tax=Klebsiella pneumoniae TaxID=573 RepID=UPI0015F2A75E